MNDLMDPPAGIGHNRPGPLSSSQVLDYLNDSQTALIQRRDELVHAVDAFLERHPTIDSDDVQAAATENLEMIRKALAKTEEERKDAKEPYLLGGRLVDAWFKGLANPLQDAAVRLRKPAQAYAERLERARRAAAEAEAKRLAEEAARREREAVRSGQFDAAIELARQADTAAQHAAARPAEHSRTTGTYGSVSSLRERWVFEITQQSAVPREYCVPSATLIRDAIQASSKDPTGKPILTIPGVRIYPERKLATRS